MKLLFILISILFCSSLFARQEICPEVIIHGDEISLTDTETRMVCGDKKLSAYKEIPAYEAKFFFQGFLQSRGYLQPQFKIENKVLHVYPGDKSDIKRISVKANNKELQEDVNQELDRLFEDKVLSTGILNQIEGVALDELRNRGYPCADVTSEALIDKDRVIVTLNDHNKFEFGEYEKESVEGLRDNALDRYYPFKSNQTFDQRLLQLTEKRMIRADVVQGTYFLEKCEEDTFSMSQHFITGPPRTIRFGIGASTEVGPMVRIRWSNNRYKPMASILSANLQASFRNQSLNLSADSFLWNHRPRRSLYSQFEIIRDSQLEYEQLVMRVKPHMKWTRDSEGYHKVYTLGPTYEGGTYRSNERSDTRSFSTGIVEGGILWTSHDYELFDLHPQAGDIFNFNFDLRHPTVGFSEELLKLKTSYLKLARLMDSGRGTIVGGARLNLGTTWVKRDVSLNSLPPTVKFYGGGSDDIRGFQLQTLPDNQGLGALTKIGLKLELRRTYVYKESIEAFTFLDSAYFGDQSWDIRPSMYYSPGAGFRWLSPIGVVQLFGARGFKTKPFRDFGNLFYIGIGGTF